MIKSNHIHSVHVCERFAIRQTLKNRRVYEKLCNFGQMQKVHYLISSRFWEKEKRKEFGSEKKEKEGLSQLCKTSC